MTNFCTNGAEIKVAGIAIGHDVANVCANLNNNSLVKPTCIKVIKNDTIIDIEIAINSGNKTC